MTGAAARVAGEWPALAALPAPPPARTWRYGPHASQVVDFHGDPAGPRVTVLHGGYWRQRHDRGYLAATAGALAAEGYAVALAEYRRVGGGGRWPEMSADVAAVVAGAWPDGAAQVLLGHSAGGQLALWAAHRLPERVRGVVAVGPVADLALARELGLSDHAVDELLGPDGPLDDADPGLLLPAARPAVLLHGTDDPDVPVELSRRYAAASGAALRELPGTGHFAALTPGSAAFPHLLDALREFA
ncbi:alpha/beta fold hydrolase [Streptomyces sp. SL13]|uniref:Alpha/beta fold hydrolase n=1 Tax=Streptantibioticus silvisoli TaxID=2705255 RepID=A0AA90H622_9ACTN|nr:alpha/beta fold hydrolase [Streptantibioticus silvisoli]MDI5971284.1 alpha/beta fold hydrolase [Streptantibioticus silvisoli]